MPEVDLELAALSPGAHICFPFENREEHRRSVTSFVAHGIRRGEHVRFVGTREDLNAVETMLTARQLPVTRLQADGALQLLDQASFFETAGGHPQPRHLAALVADGLQQARRGGFTGFRGVGEAPVHKVEASTVLEYERLVSDCVTGRPAAVMCAYDLATVPPGLLIEALHLHPSALRRGHVCGNPFHDHGAPAPDDDARRLAWMLAQLDGRGDRDRRAAAMKQALIREATSLAIDLERHRDVVQTLAHTVRTREMLIALVSRQVRATVEPLRSAFETLLSGGRGDDLLELCREEIDSLARLSDRLDEAAAFVGEPLDLQIAPVDIAALLRAIVAEFQADPRFTRVPVNLRAPTSLMGDWDLDRLRQALLRLLAVAAEHGWRTLLQLDLEARGPSARLTVRYHAPEADPLAGSAGLGVAAPGGPSTYDRLGIELWPTRELVRLMGGTLGVSTWADAHVTFTLELLRSGEPSEPR